MRISDQLLFKKGIRLLLLIRRFSILLFTSKGELSGQSEDLVYTLVFVCHKKDIDILEVSLHESRKNINGIEKEILLIYPDEQKEIFRKRFEKIAYTEFTDEQLFQKFAFDHTYSVISEMPKAGWIKQQILKFMAALIVKTPYYFVLDSDTIIVDKMSFREEGKPVFYFSDELEFSYRRFIKKVLGDCEFSTLSFVSHMCMFEVEKVKSLFHFLNSRSNKESEDEISEIKNAVSVLVEAVDFNDKCLLSEYELYYYFIDKIDEQGHIIKYWRNKALNYRIWGGGLERYADNYYSLSFHDYYRK